MTKRFCPVVFLFFLSTGPAFGADVGTIPGVFDVNQSGSAQYSIQLKLSPGTAGTQPKINLAYDSQATGGPLGAGWSISGFSVITRGPKTFRTDGVAKGVVLDDSDALFLDGQRLVPVHSDGVGATKKTYYKKDIDSIDRIIQTGESLSTATFEVRTKGGTRLYFDGADGSRVKLGDGSVLLLAVNRIEDSSGNYIRFLYGSNGAGDYVLRSVKYTGHRTYQNNVVHTDLKPFATVDFAYEANVSPQTGYIAGREVRKEFRLKETSVRISASREDSNPRWITSARYMFEYEPRTTLGRFVLTRVTQFGEESANSLQPTTFEYSKPTIGWAPSPNALPAFAIAAQEKLSAAYLIGNIAPGSPTILFSALIEGKHEAHAYQRSASGWEKLVNWAPPFAFVASDGADLGLLALDVNEDGRLDILQSFAPASGPSVRRAYLSGTTGWAEQPGFVLPFDIVTAGKRDSILISARFSGGPGPDLLYQTPQGSGFLSNTASGWSSAKQLPPTVILGVGAQAFDVDCDGKPELVVPYTVSGKTLWRVFRFSSNGWNELGESDKHLVPPIPPHVEPEAVLTARLSEASCPALLVSSKKNGIQLALQPTKHSGWEAQPQFAPPFPMVDAAGTRAGAIAVDLNGDGRDDVVAVYKDTVGKFKRFVFLQAKNGWISGGQNYLPETLNSTADRSGQFIDLDADGLLDLVIPGNGRSGVSAFYAGTRDGFIPRPQYIPTVALAAASRQDRGIRFIDLNGDGLTDVIFRRDEVDGTENVAASGAFLNTANGWIAVPGLKPRRALASPTISGDPVQFLDADGDGFVDMLYSYRRRDGTLTREMYRNEADGSGSRRWVLQDNSPYSPPADVVFAQEGIGDFGVRFVDLNGDGRIDIVASQLKSKNSLVPNAQVEICDSSVPPKCDLDRSQFDSVAYLNTGKGWTKSDVYAPPLPIVSRGLHAVSPSEQLGVELVDLNGDRLVDIVARFIHPHDESKEVSEVWVNSGGGWIKSTMVAPTLLDEFRRNRRVSSTWLDINGDGLVDFLQLYRQGAQNRSKVWLSTGNGFASSSTWVPPVETFIDREGDAGYRFVDLNGDGLLDILFARKSDASTVARGALINTGSTWGPAKPVDVATLPPLVDENGNEMGIRLVDVNGDGMLDVVRSYAPGPSEAVVEQQAWLNTGRRSDMLERVDTGNGLVTRIYYQSLPEQTLSISAGEPAPVMPWHRVYERGNDDVTYPLSAPTPSLYVVRRVVNELGRHNVTHSYSYRYGGYRFNLEEMRSLGFAWRERLDESASTITRSEFSQQVLLTGKPLREATCLLQSALPGHGIQGNSLCPSAPQETIRLLNETVNTWSTRTTLLGKRAVSQVSLERAETSIWELDGKLVSREWTTLTYDEPTNLLSRRQNVLRTVISREDGSSIVTSNEYAQDDEALWHLGRLTSVEVTRTARPSVNPAEPQRNEVRNSTFSYDPNTGLLVSETSDATDNEAGPGDDPAGQAVNKAYGRDVFGNITSITTTAVGLRRRTETTFDSLGRFPIEQRIITSSRTFRTTLAPALSSGLPLRTFDEDNLRPTVATYDEFGRIKSLLSAGVTTQKAYLRLQDIPGGTKHQDVGGIFAVRTQRGSLPPSFEIFDTRGKVVRTVSIAFSLDDKKQRLVYIDRHYDVLGRQSAVSLPYEVNEAARWINTSFDAIGRIRAVQYPDGVTITNSYSGREKGGRIVVGSDEFKNTTTNVLDARGRLESVTDANGNSVQYQYDAADRLERVQSPKGFTHIQYKHGHRAKIADSNFGTWLYEHDPFGQLVKQTDGRGVSLMLTYDELGRIRTKTGGNRALSWTYDTSAYGVGQLATMSVGGNFEKVLAYDRHGRLAAETATIGSETFITAYQRDALGRIEEVSYPRDASGLPVRIRNVYDENGYVKRITDPTGLTVYWQALETDADGKVSHEVLGNGDQIERVYDPNTRRLARAKSTSENGAIILDLTLRFDEHGNLKKRQEATQQIDERFEFDSLNRLREMSGTPVGAETIEYDSAGRIRSRTSAGKYEYWDGVNPAQWQPSHAVLRVPRFFGEDKYEYDLNGNLISAPFGKLRYNATNQLEQISNGGRWVSLDYEPGGERFRQTSVRSGDSSETLYVGLFERRVTSSIFGGLVQHFTFRYPIVAPTGIVAVIESQGTAATGAPQPTTKISSQVYYLHKDQLGSVVRVTDSGGRLAAQFWYSPFGSRTVANATPGFAEEWFRGFTGHEALEQFGLLHMGGRVYSPALGIFISPDAVGGDLTSPQSLNLYAYGLNNPLFYTDPTGYWNWGGAIVGGIVGFVTGGPGGAVAGAAIGGNDDSRRWVEQNWREVAVTAVAIGVTVATAGAASPILAGMIVGASTGATSAILYGGNLDEVLAATCRGAVIGAISGAAYDVVGTEFIGTENSVGAVVSHGAVGGSISAIQGDNFWQGFAAAALTKYTSRYEFASTTLNVTRAAVVGGTIAEINGGKFANGAIQGVYSYGLNDLAHRARWVMMGATVGAGSAAAGSLVLDAATGGLNTLATPEEIAFGAAAGGTIGGKLYDMVFSEKGQGSRPMTGEPGSIVQRPNGTRRYGPDRYPEVDVDTSPHHGHPVPHAHDWGRPADGQTPTDADRGKWRHVKEGDPVP